MHGQPRKAPKPEDAAAAAAKAEKLRSLQSLFLSYHHDCIYTEEALQTSGKLLEINPEHYTAWNYRKLAAQHLLKLSESDPDSIKKIFDEELRVVESALLQNFKSYGAWHHRKWVLSKGYSSIDKELRLLNHFQKADSRNFHAWNYRRFVATLMNRSLEDELKYTEDLIGINFSNYSAWHNRSILLLKKDQGLSTKDDLEKEYDFVRNALFIDPDDQSGWFYHLWLVEQTIKSEASYLVASWPPRGSDIIVLRNNCSEDSASVSLSGVPLNLKKFPVILHFNQNVEGVNSSTVTIQANCGTSKDIKWEPLSPKYAQAASVWVAYLDISSSDLDSSSPSEVEVSVGTNQGIVSPSGFHLSKSLHIVFTLSSKSAEADSPERQKNEILSWTEDDFSPSQSLQQSVPADALAVEHNFDSTALEWRKDVIEEEIRHFRELLELDNCKIGKLTLARLLTAYDVTICSYENHSEEVLQLYSDLIKLDLPHSQHYKDEHSVALLRQITSSKENLLKHCFSYKINNSEPLCLRLNNLSLSRLGSFEKLLWVQMLDLSGNELHSVEGLEAMQLVTYLNLKNNKLASFTALEPLQSIKSLKALDISYNEIGAHSIDTTRYLCASPLNHTKDIAWNRDEELLDGDDNKSYWEANLVFKDLKLVQLEVAGNAVADEKFKAFLVKIMPGLKWLDGEKLP